MCISRSRLFLTQALSSYFTLGLSIIGIRFFAFLCPGEFMNIADTNKIGDGMCCGEQMIYFILSSQLRAKSLRKLVCPTLLILQNQAHTKKSTKAGYQKIFRLRWKNCVPELVPTITLLH